MNHQEKKATKRYLQDIRFILPVYHKNERRFLNDIQHMIEEYADTDAVITYDSLVQEFGHPKDQAMYYLTEKDDELLYKEITISKMMRFGLLFVAAILLFLLYYHCYTNYKIYQSVSREQLRFSEPIENSDDELPISVPQDEGSELK